MSLLFCRRTKLFWRTIHFDLFTLVQVRKLNIFYKFGSNPYYNDGAAAATPPSSPTNPFYVNEEEGEDDDDDDDSSFYDAEGIYSVIEEALP